MNLSNHFKTTGKQLKNKLVLGILLLMLMFLILACVLHLPTPTPVVNILPITYSNNTNPTPTQSSASSLLSEQPIPTICSFQFNKNALSIVTNTLEMKIQAGAVSFVKDKQTGEILVDTNPYENRPTDKEFIGYTVSSADKTTTSKSPLLSSPPKFTQITDCQASLVYDALGEGNQPTSGELQIKITIVAPAGDVLLQAIGVDPSGLQLSSINIPIMRTTTPAVILGSGAFYARHDARATDQTTYVDYGLYAPTMAVIQGETSVLAVWSESTLFAPEYIRLQHTPEFDQLVLHAQQDPATNDLQGIVSPPWRINTFSAWEKAARAWRNSFETRTGAKPLWKNHTKWVRNIHSVIDATFQDYGTDSQTYAELAKITPPKNTLFFLWNGDRIVLYGDPTLVDIVTRPSPEFLPIIKSYDWPMILYHPYTIIRSRAGTVKRLAFLTKQGWLPANYQFTPAYEGKPENWHTYWDDISTNYQDGSEMSILHPGAIKFKNYFVKNLADYLTRYGASGAYLDIQGADQNTSFLPEKRVTDGSSYVLGEISTMEAIIHDLPVYGIMSEYQSPWILPYIFFSWEGALTHTVQNLRAGTRLNHPLRVALTGSYAWTRESTANYDAVASALMGALPQVSLNGDQGVDESQVAWSQARAKLFCDEELFNDLPETWDADALAYYRSQKTGHWFKFKLIEKSYGYVEILANGTEVIRLVR